MAIKEKLSAALSKKVGDSEIDYSQVLFILGLAAIAIYVYSKSKGSIDAARSE